MTLGLTVTNARQWQTIYYINFGAVYETSGTGILDATYAVHVVHDLKFVVAGKERRKEGRKVSSKLGELLKQGTTDCKCVHRVVCPTQCRRCRWATPNLAWLGGKYRRRCNLWRESAKRSPSEI